MLGDGYGAQTLGCTAGITMSAGVYQFWVESSGVVRGNNLPVGNASGTIKWLVAYNIPVSGSSTKSISFSPQGETWDVFNVYEAFAHALSRNTGGLSGANFTTEVEDPTNCDDPTNSCVKGGIIHIINWKKSYKFRIVHEVGHRMAGLVGVDASGGYNYDGNGECIAPDCGGPQCVGSPGGWEPKSLEWVATAEKEGFADFFAADTWNSHSETDCWIYWIGGGDNCANSNHGGTELAWVDGETCRSPDDPESGAAIDWLRAFWSVHVVRDPHPTFTYMVDDWLAGAGSWEDNTAYLEIDGRAHYLANHDPVGPGSILLQNWNEAKRDNFGYYCTDGYCD